MKKLLPCILIGDHPNESTDLLNPSYLSRSYPGINVKFKLLEFMSFQFIIHIAIFSIKIPPLYLSFI